MTDHTSPAKWSTSPDHASSLPPAAAATSSATCSASRSCSTVLASCWASCWASAELLSARFLFMDTTFQIGLRGASGERPISAPEDYLGPSGKLPGCSSPRGGLDGVVPVPMKFVLGDRESRELLVRDLGALGVLAVVELRSHLQAAAGAGGRDQLDADLIAAERTASPVERDRGKQPVLDRVPLGC